MNNKYKGFDVDISLENYLSTIDCEEDINLFWSYRLYNGDCTPIKFNCVPFVLLNKRRYICHQCKDKDVNS